MTEPTSNISPAEQPKQKWRWFRFHLQMALVVMFVAAVLLLIQVRERRTPVIDDGWWVRSAELREVDENPKHKFAKTEMAYYGWPYFAVAKDGWFFLRGTRSGGTYNARYDIFGTIVDAAVMLLFIFIGAFASELIIRRRDI